MASLTQQLQRQIQGIRDECFGDAPGCLGLPDTAQVIYSYFNLRGQAKLAELTEPDVSRLARQLHVPQEVIITKHHSPGPTRFLSDRSSAGFPL